MVDRGTLGHWSLVDYGAFARLDPEARHSLWTSSLPEDEETDPALWKSLVLFFSAAIDTILSRPGERRALSCRELDQMLMWDGSSPACFPEVVSYMLGQGTLVNAARDCTLDDIPVANTAVADGLIMRSAATIATHARRIWNSSSPMKVRVNREVGPTDLLVAPKIVTRDAESLLKECDAEQSYISSLRTFQELQDVNCRGSRVEAVILLAELFHKQRCPVIKLDPGCGEYGVKLRVGGKIGQGDQIALRLKHTITKIENAEKRLQSAIVRENDKAKTLLRPKSEDKSKIEQVKHILCLRKLKEKQLENARNNKIQVYRVLNALEETHSNKEVLGVLEQGTHSLQEITKNADMTVERVDAALTEVDSSVAEADEINEIFAQRAEVEDPDVLKMVEDLALEMEQEENTPPSQTSNFAPAPVHANIKTEKDIIRLKSASDAEGSEMDDLACAFDSVQVSASGNPKSLAA